MPSRISRCRPWLNLTRRSCRRWERPSSRKCSVVCSCRSFCGTTSLAMLSGPHRTSMTWSWAMSMGRRAPRKRSKRPARSKRGSLLWKPRESDFLTNCERMSERISQTPTTNWSRMRMSSSASRSQSSHHYGATFSSRRNSSCLCRLAWIHPQITYMSSSRPFLARRKSLYCDGETLKRSLVVSCSI